MRDAIGDRLLTIVTELNDVYGLHGATSNSDKPFAVILMGEETEASDWVGFQQMVEIRPYVTLTSFVTLDQIVKAITTALMNQVLQTSEGHEFTCKFLGSGMDQIDTELEAMTRVLRFVVHASQAVDVTDIAEDPWLEALAGWTEQLFTLEPPAEDVWHVYRARWPLGYARPSVLWRLSEFEVHGISHSTIEIRKQFIGHVLGSTPNEQVSAILQIVEQLQTVMKLPLNMAERKFMMIIDPRANLKAEAISNGQINVTLSRKSNRSNEEAPLMTGLQHIGNLD